MKSLVTLASSSAVFLFGGLFAVVFWKLFTGSISLDGMLEGDVRDQNGSDGSGFSSSPSAGRTQMLLVTLFVAMWYLLQVIHNPREFPKLPDAMVGALAGSQAMYLGGKAKSMLVGQLRDWLK
jgi:hypothetical protein